MQRRDFIKMSAILASASVLPGWSPPLWAAERPALPIPPRLAPDAQGKIALTLQTGSMSWTPRAQTTTWGINGGFLGPALVLERGRDTTIHIANTLPESTTIHWHGLEIPGEADGGPQAVIAPGGRRAVRFTLDQPATTAWFHPHSHATTGRHVAMGLGGLILVRDPDADALGLPSRWGIDDIPLILQDKRLNADGQIDYQLDVMSAAVGWFGELMLTNGANYPSHSAPRGWLRLRLLNGCNARSLNLAASDGRPLYVIGSDGGLLAEPVKVTQLPLLMGERFEVLVDTRNGKAFDLVTQPVTQMGMTLPPFDKPVPVLHIQPTTDVGKGALPDSLIALPALPARDGLTTRHLQLSMDPRLDAAGMQALMDRYGMQAMAGMPMAHHGGSMSHGATMQHGAGMQHGAAMPHDAQMQGHMQHGMHAAPAPTEAQKLDIASGNRINGAAFHMGEPLFDVKRGDSEMWSISGEGDMMLHPFHIHGAQFRILTENGRPPAAHRRGWKDIVRVEGGISEVLVTFNHPAPKEHAYMAHCHLLEHEDTGMMMSFTVS